MTRHISIYLHFFLILSTLCMAQSDFDHRNDSLQNLLNQDISDSLRMKVLEDLHFTWKNINFERSIDYCKQAIALAQKSNPKFDLGLRYQLGFAYMQAGDAVRSIEVFQDIVKEVEDKDEGGYSTVLGFIGMNYATLKDYKTALEFQIKGSNISEALFRRTGIKDFRGYLGNPHKIGEYYLNLNNVDSALYSANIAFARLDSVPLTEWNQFFSWYIKTLLGDIYYKLNDDVQSLFYYNESEKEINKYSTLRYSYIGDLIPVYLGKAKIFQRDNYLKLAIDEARRSYQLADTLQALPGMQESAAYLKTLYQQAGKLDSALIFYEFSITAKDSISNADVTRKLNAMEYADEKRKQEMTQISKEKSYERNLIYLGSGILFTLILTGFLFQQNRIKQKANQVLSLENKEVLRQREQLQYDVERFEMQALKAQLNPHFIFNCLNSIDAFIYTNDKYKATTYLNKFAKLLRNILDGSFTNTVTLQRDIQSIKLYIELEELRNNYSFKTVYEILPELENSTIQVPPLIIQPIIENAIIHGLKNRNDMNGLLKISIGLQNRRINYAIEDNGIGRAASKELMKSLTEDKISYGMNLVESRIKMFNHESKASLTTEDIVIHSKNCGTLFMVSLNI